MLHHIAQKEPKFLDAGFVGVKVIDAFYEDTRGDFDFRDFYICKLFTCHKPISKGKQPSDSVLSKGSGDSVAML